MKPSDSAVIVGVYMAARCTPFEDAINELLPEDLVDNAIKRTRELWSTLAPEVFVDSIAKALEIPMRDLGLYPMNRSPRELRTRALIALLGSFRGEELAIEREASRKRQDYEARIEELKRKQSSTCDYGQHGRSSPTLTEIIDDDKEEHTHRAETGDIPCEGL